jgi:tetratricopeptide (TPR) repeat protein
MLFRFRPTALIFLLALSLTLSCALTLKAQEDDGFGDEAVDPVKLFEKGQDAHQKNDLALAVEFYEEAIKVRPEFPEAEYQRAVALVALDRLPEAEKGFRRAIELRAAWALPHAALGALLMRLNRLDEARTPLETALKLDARNSLALLSLTDLSVRSKAPRAALAQLLGQLQRATSEEGATAAMWRARASVEHALGDNAVALVSYERALGLAPNDATARMQRAELRAAAGDFERAIEDASAALRSGTSSSDQTHASLLLARIQAQAGKKDAALKTLDALDEAAKRLPEVVALRTTITASDEVDAESCAQMSKLAETDERNAVLLARLGACYRLSDPARSLDYYRRASDLDQSNVDYASGYAAALVQARRFAEAVIVARRIISAAPDNYTAHANLAIALYELKRYVEALAEYKWLLDAKPDLTVAYFFIATSYDFLGQYPEALSAYETFLARANAKDNQLEIEKINLRLPSLRRQIARGEGVKPKKKGR